MYLNLYFLVIEAKKIDGNEVKRKDIKNKIEKEVSFLNENQFKSIDLKVKNKQCKLAKL